MGRLFLILLLFFPGFRAALLSPGDASSSSPAGSCDVAMGSFDGGHGVLRARLLSSDSCAAASKSGAASDGAVRSSDVLRQGSKHLLPQNVEENADRRSSEALRQGFKQLVIPVARDHPHARLVGDLDDDLELQDVGEEGEDAVGLIPGEENDALVESAGVDAVPSDAVDTPPSVGSESTGSRAKMVRFADEEAEEEDVVVSRPVSVRPQVHFLPSPVFLSDKA